VEGGLPDDLTNAEQDEVRALIHPEVVIRPAEGQGSLFGRSTEPDQVVKVMDLRQERLAKGLGGGHRVIRGVAGSGKTIVLIARARLLARSYPQDRILVTCFTRSLASRLREHLRDQPNIEVIHLHKLIQRVIRLTGLDRKGPPDFDAWPALALEALAVGDVDVDRYRAVLVDEAQDFATDSLRFCVEMLERRPADEQDLLIAADSAQNIFRRNFRWKDAGIQAQGRTRILRVNYRNTKEILRFAHEFLMADPTLRLDDAPDAEDELSIVPAESAERTGAEPTVTLVDDDETEVAGVVETVMGWYTNRAPARSIAVLTIRKDGVPRRVVEALEARHVPVFWVNDPAAGDNKDRAGTADDPVIVSTIHSSKGLEFPRVVVCGLGSGRSESIDDRKTIYVGLTRATEELAVITTKGHRFAHDLLAAQSES
jgi:superfamily I DNA/RNA helicase